MTDVLNHRGLEDSANWPQRSAVYVTMRDGVKIAVDVLLPKRALLGEKVPTIVLFTRYWRAYAYNGTPPHPPAFDENEAYLEGGFAVCLVDVRGSGASFGTRLTEYPPEEVEDYGQVMDWLAEQSFSNGKVFTTGISYAGNTAELATISPNSSHAGTVARYTDFDWYLHIVFPGGLRNIAFGPDWGAFTEMLDSNRPDGFAMTMPAGTPIPRGVKPVDEDRDGKLLAAAVKDHATNGNLAEVLDRVEFKDDVSRLEPGKEKSSNICDFTDAFRKTETPMWQWASWMDSGTAMGALSRYMTWPDAPLRVRIDAGTHGNVLNADPFADVPAGKPVPPFPEQINQIQEFFQRAPGENPFERRIDYLTLGANIWQRSDVWPPRDVKPTRFYLAADHALSDAAPTTGRGADEYVVNYEHGTGRQTRWTTSMGGSPVVYKKREEAGHLMQCYFTEPMARDMELTGTPLADLWITSTHTDGAFIVYLEDVAPNGKVTYLTEGHLRAIHRRELEGPAPFERFGPYRSFCRDDAMPLVPGEVARLRFPVLPISVVIRTGHRIRVGLAGADKDSFARLPATGVPTVTFLRNKAHASSIILPLKPFKG